MRLLLALCAVVAVVIAGGAPTVRLSTGLLQGQVNGAANQYLGVPYAQPPVGSLRWKRPQPPATWSGTRQATNWQSACWQANQQSIPQSEDCLYVNVWTPTNATTSSNLPVMYWIHGGGWEFGSPIGFYGNNISSQYNVVVVTVAYRLGALGFLAEPHLLQAEPFLGALGIMDQQAGLKWVQTNIAAFGGNPSRVTIYGESAGGGSVGIHLTIPSSKGLFRNAISESGVFFYPTIADMVPQALALSEAVHCANVADPAACLMALPPATINLALPVDGDIILGFRNNSYGVHWYPIIDGTFLTGQPINLAIKGSINAKNVIIGTNGQEGNGFVLPYFNYGQLSKEQFEFWVNQSYGSSFIAAAYTTYASDIQTGNYVQALADMANDFWFQCQRLLLAGATAAAGVPTYTYLFSYPYTAPGQPNIGATHADEVAFVWDDVAGMHFNSSEAALAGWMSSSWAAFATSDDPNGAKLPVQWPLRSSKNEQPINFNLQLSVLPSAYRQTYCNMWNPTLVAGAWPISA